MTVKKITYRKFRNGDEDVLFYLVKKEFYKSVEKDLTEEGTAEFLRATYEMLYEKADEYMIYVALLGKKIAGMIVVRNDAHISLFFVDQKNQGCGIGKGLLEMSQSELFRIKKSKFKMDVNSSLFAVKIYEKFGFKKTGDARISNGIKFVPMEKFIEL